MLPRRLTLTPSMYVQNREKMTKLLAYRIKGFLNIQITYVNGSINRKARNKNLLYSKNASMDVMNFVGISLEF